MVQTKGQFPFVSLFFVFFCSDCRGHVAGLTLRFEVRSQVLSAIGLAHPQPFPGSCGFFKHFLGKKNSTRMKKKLNID